MTDRRKGVPKNPKAARPSFPAAPPGCLPLPPLTPLPLPLPLSLLRR